MTFIISPTLRAELDKIDAAFKGDGIMGPRLPQYPVHEASNGRYTRQWMPAHSAWKAEQVAKGAGQ